MPKINGLSKTYRCPSCDQFNQAGNLERNFSNMQKQTWTRFPKNVYQLPETLFDKLYSFVTNYRDIQKLIKILSWYDLESICVLGDKIRDADFLTSIGKHLLTFVPVSANLIEELKFYSIFTKGFGWIIYWCSWWVSNTELAS